MTRVQQRLKRIEAAMTDDHGLIPHSPRWLAYWMERMDRVLTDGDSHTTERIPLEAFDAIIGSE